MKDTSSPASSDALIGKAISQLIEDMKSREIAAILWDNATAGFHYIPEISLKQEKSDKPEVIRIMGLYRYNDALYLVEEGMAPVELTEFYTDGVQVPPTVVTLTEDSAREHLGDPEGKPGYTRNATNEEWLVIADCYFEALAED